MTPEEIEEARKKLSTADSLTRKIGNLKAAVEKLELTNVMSICFDAGWFLSLDTEAQKQSLLSKTEHPDLQFKIRQAVIETLAARREELQNELDAL